ncbi:hypothetical protein NA56DRAFT_665619 [Hyaloscypha hepaticicola]|uniref:Uncharacterized protein n=1 Tax=Hyaloscypha hepaticicola TaxID=2082293 RepID=A0A2J6PH80_9HELO|nr:hypothetical protein NA56DRAFT_665619 [Hyaloscypha hepaticicola]
MFGCSVQHPRYVGDGAVDEIEDEVEDWVDEAEVGNVEIEDDVEELEAAAKLKELEDKELEDKELEDKELVDEEKVVDAAAKEYPEQLGVTVTVTVLMLTLVTVLAIITSPETRFERVARPMAKE